MASLSCLTVGGVAMSLPRSPTTLWSSKFLLRPSKLSELETEARKLVLPPPDARGPILPSNRPCQMNILQRWRLPHLSRNLELWKESQTKSLQLASNSKRWRLLKSWSKLQKRRVKQSRSSTSPSKSKSNSSSSSSSSRCNLARQYQRSLHLKRDSQLHLQTQLSWARQRSSTKTYLLLDTDLGGYLYPN